MFNVWDLRLGNDIPWDDIDSNIVGLILFADSDPTVYTKKGDTYYMQTYEISNKIEYLLGIFLEDMQEVGYTHKGYIRPAKDTITPEEAFQALKEGKTVEVKATHREGWYKALSISPVREYRLKEERVFEDGWYEYEDYLIQRSGGKWFVAGISGSVSWIAPYNVGAKIK